ncbi:MAG TPA: hypothetical protein VEC99_06605, partial [Clostridia bacterium]|nr:hypothetical protein [Clostridia bacterium]
QVAVVELTSTPRVVVAFGEDRESAREKIQSLHPAFQRGSYLAAFRLANSLLVNSLGQQKRIRFLGDNQENQWNENVNTAPFLRGVEVELNRVAAQGLPNVSLSEPRVQRIFLGDRSLVSFSVKVSHTGGAKTANVTLRANGQTVLNRAVDLSKEPETMMLQSQWEADTASWLQGEAVVDARPDSLEADNRVFFSLPPVIEGKVALLAQSQYLRLALSPDIMRGQWSTRVLDPAKLGAELANNEDADVLCVESSYLQSGDARRLVSRYLANGHGVFLVVDRLTPVIDGYLRELGFKPEGTVQTNGGTPEKFQFIFSHHAIFHPFVASGYGNLMDVNVSQYVRLQATGAMPLIFAESGAGLFFQGTKTPGKLFVAAFGLDRNQTSWPVHQTFIPFLDLTLQAARAEDPVPTTFEPGEMSTIPLASAATAREAALREGGREIARVPVEQGRLQLRMPDKPGLYTLSFDERERVERVFSVNPSPKESQLAYIESPEAMKVWRLPGNSQATGVTVASTSSHMGLERILQQRLWWWMVLGGVLALTLEMALAETRKEVV